MSSRVRYAKFIKMGVLYCSIFCFYYTEINPMPTENIAGDFNELRQDIVLLYELKLALANCEYELQTLRHRFETLAPGRVGKVYLYEAVETLKRNITGNFCNHSIN